MQWEREALHGLEGGWGEWVHGRIWNWYEKRRTYQSIVVIGGLRDWMVAKGWDHNRDPVTHYQWKDGVSNVPWWGGRLKTDNMGHSGPGKPMRKGMEEDGLGGGWNGTRARIEDLTSQS